MKFRVIKGNDVGEFFPISLLASGRTVKADCSLAVFLVHFHFVDGSVDVFDFGDGMVFGFVDHFLGFGRFHVAADFQQTVGTLGVHRLSGDQHGQHDQAQQQL